jgi:hypothetical protein
VTRARYDHLSDELVAAARAIGDRFVERAAPRIAAAPPNSPLRRRILEEEVAATSREIDALQRQFLEQLEAPEH